MVPVLSLWLPILVAAALVFVVSSLIHMLLPWHAGDWQRIPEEDRVADTLRAADVKPGHYTIPYAESMAAMSEPAYLEKREKGPVARVTVLKPGSGGMGRQLGLWFLYCVVVGIFVAYVAGRAVGPGAGYTAVFRFAGATAFLAYAGGEWQQSIWWGQKGTVTVKNILDGLAYALVTAGAFGWLWPDI